MRARPDLQEQRGVWSEGGDIDLVRRVCMQGGVLACMCACVPRVPVSVAERKEAVAGAEDNKFIASAARLLFP